MSYIIIRSTFVSYYTILFLESNYTFFHALQNVLFKLWIAVHILGEQPIPQGLVLVVSKAHLLAFCLMRHYHRIVFQVKAHKLPVAVWLAPSLSKGKESSYGPKIVPKFKVDFLMFFAKGHNIFFCFSPVHGFRVHVRQEQPRIFGIFFP